MWRRPAIEDCLHLLQVYETVIALRPIHQANREYLETLLVSCRSLARDLTHGEPATDRARRRLEAIESLVLRQDSGNAQATARRLLELLRAQASEIARFRSSRSLYVQRLLGPLDSDYTDLVVLFGPGLGLGDEITFRDFLRRLHAFLGEAAMSIHSLYAGLWKHLLPAARSLHYRGRPWRPFAAVEGLARERERLAKTLVVVADFDGYRFHESVLPRTPHVHVLEISLGRKQAWLRRSADGWVECASYEDTRQPNNYWNLHALAAALLPAKVTCAKPWSALVGRRPRLTRSPRYRVLLNPLSSKVVPITVAEWKRAFRGAAARLPRGTTLEVLVFPGLNHDGGSSVRELLGSLAMPGLVETSRLRDEQGRPLTPFNALAQVIRCLRRADLCVTIDTFTAHLAPLFGVPTVVIALKENRAFWVPSPHAFYGLYSELANFLPAAFSQLLRPPGEMPARVRPAGRAVVAATERALRDAATWQDVCLVQESLLRYFEVAPKDLPLAALASPWVRFFSRFVTCLRRKPLLAPDFQPFLRRWEGAELYKFIAFHS